MNEVKFYIQKSDKHGNLIDGTLKDLESDFIELRYMEAKGINR
jgi:hypothetical protein